LSDFYGWPIIRVFHKNFEFFRFKTICYFKDRRRLYDLMMSLLPTLIIKIFGDLISTGEEFLPSSAKLLKTVCRQSKALIDNELMQLLEIQVFWA